MNYDYLCEKCGHAFEENVLMANRDVPTTKPCPKCKAKKVARPPAALWMSYEGGKTLLQRARQGAGSDFVNRLEQIKKNHPDKLRSGAKNTVNA